MNSIQKNIHEKAVTIASQFKKEESKLIEIILEVEKHRVYPELGFTSLFQYCVTELKISDSQAYQFIGIARKSQIVPELKLAVDEGKITVSNARRIVSVITPENKDNWIEKAASLSQKELEFEVVKVNPKALTKETIKPVQENRAELKTYISRKLEKDLRRVQDLLSQKTKTAATLEQALEVMAELYLDKEDPIRKAERVVKKELCLDIVQEKIDKEINRDRKVEVGRAAPKFNRFPIPANIKHQVVLRDKNQCTHNHYGRRCHMQRWVQLHHRVPVSEGGLNTVSNLQTLCFYHHKHVHKN